MKKLLLLLTLLVTAVGSLCAETWTSTMTKDNKSTLLSTYTGTSAPSTWTDTSNDLKVQWDFSYVWKTATQYVEAGANGLKLGASGKGIEKVTFSTSDVPGIISKISLDLTSNDTSGKVSVMVGDIAYVGLSTNPTSFASSAKTFSFEGEASGKIEIVIDIPTKDKYVTIQNLKVEYTPTPPTPATVGDISVKVGSEDFVDEGDYYLGDTFTFSAENAGYMYVVNDTQEELTVTDGVATWTPSKPDVYDATVYAMIAKGNSQNMQEKELVFTLNALGEIVATSSDGQQIEDEGEYTIEQGTTLTFSSFRADNITVTDANDNVLATGNSSVSYTPSLSEETYLFVNATRTNNSTIYSQDFAIILHVVEGTTAMGNAIVVRLNDEVVNYPEDEVQNLYVQDKLSFYCKNADHIEVYASPGYGGNSYTFDGQTAEFPLGALSLENTWTLSVSAYQGTNPSDDDKVRRSINIKLDDREPLGEVIAMANGAPIEYSYDEFYQKLPYEVYPGTVITFTCENADKFLVYASTEGIYNQEFDLDGSFTLTQLGDQNIQIIAKKSAYPGVESRLEFNVTVVEKPENLEYTVVKAGEAIVPGQRYVLAGTGVSKADSNVAVDYVMNTYDNGSSAKRITSVIPANAIDYTNGILEMNPNEAHTFLTFEKADNKGFYAKLGDQYLAATLKSTGAVDNKISLIDEPSDLAYVVVDIDENNHALLKFAKSAEEIANCAWIHLFSQKSSDSYWQCYTNHSSKKDYQLYKYDITPVFDQIEEDPSIVSFTANKGELHIWMTEYNSEGEIIWETESDANSPMRAPAANWTNKMGEKGETLTISVPTTEGNVLTIQAKSVVNGLHSEEVVKHVDANGQIVAGVETVVASEAEGAVEYYNMQGVRVDGRAPGLYIRRQGSKVEKVLVK